MLLTGRLNLNVEEVLTTQMVHTYAYRSGGIPLMMMTSWRPRMGRLTLRLFVFRV